MKEELYVIPKKYRLIENFHILFWLIKDLCWCLVYKPLGIVMIFPTLSVAIYITWQNRSNISELFHNLAVIFWITANSIWMISEFFGFDEKKIFGEFVGKNFALIPFGLGISCLLYYYLIIVAKERKALK